MENRFRLVQQPIAAWRGEDQKMFDVRCACSTRQGKEVLPSEFLPAAARNDLLKNIDRWVIGASLSFAAKRKPDLLFVRLSRDSALMRPAVEWLEDAAEVDAVPSRGGCACRSPRRWPPPHLAGSARWSTALRERGFRFALEHFGAGRDSHSSDRRAAARLRQDRRLADAGARRRIELQQRVRVDRRGGRQAH